MIMIDLHYSFIDMGRLRKTRIQVGLTSHDYQMKRGFLESNVTVFHGVEQVVVVIASQISGGKKRNKMFK